MEENKDYKVYRFDYLTEGSQLKFEHSVYCEDVDISSLITQGIVICFPTRIHKQLTRKRTQTRPCFLSI